MFNCGGLPHHPWCHRGGPWPTPMSIGGGRGHSREAPRVVADSPDANQGWPWWCGHPQQFNIFFLKKKWLFSANQVGPQSFPDRLTCIAMNKKLAHITSKRHPIASTIKLAKPQSLSNKSYKMTYL